MFKGRVIISYDFLFKVTFQYANQPAVPTLMAGFDRFLVLEIYL